MRTGREINDEPEERTSMARVQQTNGNLKCREERVRMADMLRGKDPIAGLFIPEIKKAITQAWRSDPTTETNRAPRWYRMGGVVAEVCLRLLFWEGKESDERGVHKSFAELEAETGYSRRQLQTARRVAEEEGLLVATPGFRPDATGQRTLFWRLDMWQLHEVVFESALEATRTQLEREGRRQWRDRLNKKRRGLEQALHDLRLSFLDEQEESTEAEP